MRDVARVAEPPAGAALEGRPGQLRGAPQTRGATSLRPRGSSPRAMGLEATGAEVCASSTDSASCSVRGACGELGAGPQ